MLKTFIFTRVSHAFLRDKKGREWAILGGFWCVVCIKYLYKKPKSWLVLENLANQITTNGRGEITINLPKLRGFRI